MLCRACGRILATVSHWACSDAPVGWILATVINLSGASEVLDVRKLRLSVVMNFLKPTFYKGSASPLVHHPPEVVEEKGC